MAAANCWAAAWSSNDGAYPFMLTTGRVVHHFHTRTKTGRVPALAAAAPEPYIQMSDTDARRLQVRSSISCESMRSWS